MIIMNSWPPPGRLRRHPFVDAEDAGLQETLRLSMGNGAGPRKETEPLAQPDVEERYPTAEEYAEAKAQLYRAGITPTCDLLMALEKAGEGEDDSWIKSPGCKRLRYGMYYSDLAQFPVKAVPLWWQVENGESQETLPFLVQHGGGPCGVLAALGGFVLRYLIFPEKESGPREDLGTVTAEARTAALIDSMATMMIRCKNQTEETDGYVCALVAASKDDCKGAPTMWRRSVQDIAEYQKLLIQYTGPLLDSQTAIVSFLVSLLLTRGGPEMCRSDMDDPGNVLVGMFGHCSQELVNLCLLGRCVSNVFDGQESLGGGMMLRGVPADIPIVVGYITELEALRYVTVGSRYKNPELPLWVIGSPNHYTLLFSRNLHCVKRNPISVARDKLKDIFDANCTVAGIATVEQADKMILDDIPDDLIPPGSSRAQMVAVVKESALDGSIVLFDSFQSTFCKALFGEARMAEVDSDSRRPSAYTMCLYDGQKPGGPSLREIKVRSAPMDCLVQATPLRVHTATASALLSLP
ncbi:hypothetical protein FOZ61_000288 [Perkinsus olseni]|uniref:Deubiquitinating enzyme MINDY-3/4 conserved domain-containing protein n=1 Tax=Perkinsus olseni TaxID=32597 RepID=A0A7J6KYB6_PEROL|nr:hypothetical protein FOZ61_000288 [Perkinsus olseni]KAF4651561.1 hypothetical protein FOL46_000254 [Perkinsus olseni]